MSQLVWTKFTQDMVIGGREFLRGTVTELTIAEFKQAVVAGAAVPCGERGRMLTVNSVAREMKIGGSR